MSETDFLKYLSPDYVSKLNSLELKAKSIVEGFLVGLHKSPYHGFSAEFSEHRSYMQGDPIKNIDWKVYGKSDKYFIKQYEEETNLISHLIIDTSLSMSFQDKGIISKGEYAKILAAGLAYIMLRQQDAVGLATFSEKINNYIRPKANKNHISNLINYLDKSEYQGETKIADSLVNLSSNICKRGLVIIFSDFFDNPDDIIKALKMFRYNNSEVIIFQILDPNEKEFEFSSDIKFKDLETGEKLSTQPVQIQMAYKQTFQEYLKKLNSECLNNRIEYNLITTDTPFDKAMLNYYKKRKQLF